MKLGEPSSLEERHEEKHAIIKKEVITTTYNQTTNIRRNQVNDLNPIRVRKYPEAISLRICQEQDVRFD